MRMSTIIRTLVSVSALVIGLPRGANAQSPQQSVRPLEIAEVYPAVAAPNDTISIRLTSDHRPVKPQVLIDGLAAQINQARERELVITVPLRIQTGEHCITVVDLGVRSPPFCKFSVEARQRPAPRQQTSESRTPGEPLRIVSVEPREAPAGDSVTIRLNRMPAGGLGALAVTFNGIQAVPVRGAGTNAIRVNVPFLTSSDTTACIIITTVSDGARDCNFAYTYLADLPATIKQIVPTTVQPGDSFTATVVDWRPGDNLALSVGPLRIPFANTNRDSIASVLMIAAQMPEKAEAGDTLCLHLVRGDRTAANCLPGAVAASRRGGLLQWLPTILGVLSLIGAAIIAFVSMKQRRLRSRHSADQVVVQKRLDEALLTIDNIRQPSMVVGDPAGETEYERLPVPEPPPELVQACISGKCVLFAGGGIGAQANVPTWLQSLERIATRLAEQNDEAISPYLKRAAGNPEIFAELLASRVDGEVLTGIVREVYAESTGALPPFFNTLADIRFGSVVSPNWDTSLERAFARREPLVASPRDSRALVEALRDSRFTILKVWGEPSERSKLIFTPEEYRRATYDDPSFGRYLASLFAERTFFFAGTSVGGINDFLSVVQFNHKSRTHYALVPWSDDIELHREILRGKYGIELIVFSPSAGYPEVHTFFEKLRDATKVPQAAPELESATLSRVVLHNIGPFTDLDLTLQPTWNVLLGNNGFGKSTILRAICLGLCGSDVPSSGMSSVSALLRSGTDHGWIELQVGASTYRTDLERKSGTVEIRSRQLTPLQTGRWVVLGFPPLRGVSLRALDGATNKDAPNYPVVDDLMPLLRGSIDSRMDNLKQWIVNTVVRAEGGGDLSPAEVARYAQLRDAFFSLMDRITPGERLRYSHLDKREWRVMVQTEGGVVPIDVISQGMSSMMAWVGVLLLRMFEIYGHMPNPERQNALVLVDEIDAHMHPEWQRTVVQFVREYFPNLQVVATTHSPLVVGTMQHGEVLQVTRNRAGVVEISMLEMTFQGLRADQILTSAAFALDTTLDVDTHKRLNEYSELLGKMDKSDADVAHLAQMEVTLDRLIPSHPETEEGRIAINLMGEWMDHQLKGQPPEKMQKIKSEAEAYLMDLMPSISQPQEGSKS